MQEEDFMMSLSDAVIIGHMGTFDHESVPTTVAPIFQIKNGEQVIMPPYEMGPYYIKGEQTNLASVKELKSKDKLELFVKPYKVCPGYVLWLDVSGGVHYTSELVMQAEFKRIYYQYISSGIVALKNVELTKAKRSATIASLADESGVEAYALKAAADQHVQSGLDFDMTYKPRKVDKNEFLIFCEYYFSMIGKK